MTINLDQYTNTLNVTDTATNADLNVTTKGTGVVVATGGTLQAATTGSNGNLYLGGPNVSLRSAYSANVFGMYTNNAEQVRIGNVASAVNYIQLVGAPTGSSPVISAQGSDSNIQIQLQAKGTGLVRFTTGGGLQAYVSDTVSAVNYHQFTGSTTGNAVVHSVAGSDTNIDLAFTPKGTGNVRFGTYTANMALTIQGYVEIKDSGGTVRRLAVIA